MGQNTQPEMRDLYVELLQLGLSQGLLITQVRLSKRYREEQMGEVSRFYQVHIH